MIQSIKEGYEAEGRPAAMIVGDLNADIEDIPAVATLLSEEGWHDAGRHPTALDPQGNPQPTCRPEGSKKASRRYYAFLSQGAATHFVSMQVEEDSPFSVHSPLELVFRPERSEPPRRLEIYQPLDTFIPRDEAGKRQVYELKGRMDQAFKQDEHALTTAWYGKDIDTMWKTWSSCVENAFRASDTPFKKGRGRTTFSSQKQEDPTQEPSHET